MRILSLFSRRALVLGGLIGIAIFAAAEIAALIFYREFWVDELFAAWRSYLIFKGEFVPFRDGVFPYPPLIIPMHGAVQYLFGPSLYAGRVLMSAFFAGVLFLVYRLAARHGGRGWAFAALALIVSNVLLAGNYVSATTYALVMFILLCVVASETWEISRDTKILIAGGANALLLLTRTNMIVVPIAFAVYYLLIKIPVKDIIFFMMIVGGLTVVGYLPLIVFDPSLAIAYTVSSFGNIGLFKDVPPSLKEGGQSVMQFLEVFTGFVKEYFGIVALFGAISWAVLWEKRRELAAFLRREHLYLLLLCLSAALMGSHYFYPRIAGHVYYANYFIPVMVLAVVIGSAKFFAGNRFVSIMVGAVIVLSFAANLYRVDVVSNPREESDIARVNRGAAFLAAHTGARDRIVTLDNSIIHIFAADRQTFAPLMNRTFLLLGDADTAKVARLGFYNLDMVRFWLLERADFLAIHQERWPSSVLRMPFWGKGTEDAERGIAEIQSVIDTKYELVGTVLNVYPRKYTEGNDGGTLVLYKRKP